jgi:hypothetical protein
MDSHLENLARRVEEDPFFLACPLRLYAQTEGLDETKLLAALECSKETLTMVRLCRTPRAESEHFQKDIDQIVLRFPVNANVLAEAVRRGQVIMRMRQASGEMNATQPGAKVEFTLAARDEKGDPDHPKKGGV